MVCWHTRTEIGDDVSAHGPTHVRFDRGGSAQLEEGCEVTSIESLEHLRFVIAAKHRHSVRLGDSKQPVENPRRVGALVHVITKEHCVFHGGVVQDQASEPVQRSDVPVNITDEGGLCSCHSRIFSISA